MKLKLLSALCALTFSAASGADTVTASYQDWWWNPAQSGMGVNIGQNGDTLVVAWYHFADDGRGTYLMVSGELNGNTLAGDLYRASGPQPGPGYDPAQVVSTKVGTATIQFPSLDQAVLIYSFDGKSGKTTLQRFMFKQPPLPMGNAFGALYVLDKECSATGTVVGTDGNSTYVYRVDVDPEDTKLFQFDPERRVVFATPGESAYTLGTLRFQYSTPRHEYLLAGKDVAGIDDFTDFYCEYQFAFSNTILGLEGASGTAQCNLSIAGAQLKAVQGTYTGPLTVTHVTWNDGAIVAEYSARTTYNAAVCNEKGKIIFDSAK